MIQYEVIIIKGTMDLGLSCHQVVSFYIYLSIAAGRIQDFREGGPGNCLVLKCGVFVCTHATFFFPLYGSAPEYL